ARLAGFGTRDWFVRLKGLARHRTLCEEIPAIQISERNSRRARARRRRCWHMRCPHSNGSIHSNCRYGREQSIIRLVVSSAGLRTGAVGEDVVNQYRKNAEGCLLVAESATTAEHKTLLIEMARCWFDLAERAVERRSQDPNAKS